MDISVKFRFRILYASWPVGSVLVYEYICKRGKHGRPIERLMHVCVFENVKRRDRGHAIQAD